VCLDVTRICDVGPIRDYGHSLLNCTAKGHPITGHEGPEEYMYSYTLSSNSGPDVGGCSTPLYP